MEIMGFFSILQTERYCLTIYNKHVLVKVIVIITGEQSLNAHKAWFVFLRPPDTTRYHRLVAKMMSKRQGSARGGLVLGSRGRGGKGIIGNRAGGTGVRVI